MLNEQGPTELTFTYEEQQCGCAHVFLSDGLNTTGVWGSHIFSPLQELLAAFVEVLRYSDESRCRWFTEPGEQRWVFRRDGNLLHLTILGFRDFTEHRADEYGEVEFSTTCDLAYFARKLWLVISRIGTTQADSARKPDPQPGSESTDHLPNNYEILRSFIEEQKRQQVQPRVKRSN